MKDTLLIVILIVSIVLVGSYIYRSLTAPEYRLADATDAISIFSDPLQSAAPDTTIPMIRKGKERYTLLPQARYQLNGQVVSYRRYYHGYMHYLSPWDYATLWGNTDQYLPYLKFNQVVRFCLFNTRHPEKVDFVYVQRHMANNHLIPSNQNIRKALGKVKKSDLVRIDGFLVNVIGVDKKNLVSRWNSSTTREDTGNGACEIIYVTRLRLNERIYE